MNSAIDRINEYPTSIYNRNLDSDIGKRWQIFAIEIEILKLAFNSLYGLKDFSTQSGLNLDMIGENLLQLRNGMTDELYKIFLAIANSKRSSKGDIFSLNEIASTIIAGSGNLFRIEELCYRTGIRFLDATWPLNGDIPLSGSLKEPATLEITFRGTPATLKVIPEFNLAINEIRAGGVQAIISYLFEIHFSEMEIYSYRASSLDGSWNLNGSFLLSGLNIELNPFEIALGTGAEPGGILRDPQPGDTGLQNEVIRKLATIRRDLEGNQYFEFVIKPAEAIGSSINEIAFFDEDGDVMAIASFEGKPKDQFITYTFRIMEGL